MHKAATSEPRSAFMVAAAHHSREPPLQGRNAKQKPGLDEIAFAFRVEYIADWGKEAHRGNAAKAAGELERARAEARLLLRRPGVLVRRGAVERTWTS